MVFIRLVFILVISTLTAKAQIISQTMTKGLYKTETRVLGPGETASLFDDSLRNKIGIYYAIQKAVYCKDQAGESYLLFTANKDKILPGAPDGSVTHIVLFNINLRDSSIIWKMQDFIKREEKGNENNQEYTIGYYFDYTKIEDLDADGLFDPIIVTYTEGSNGIDDGRIKLLFYTKGQKLGIRHQNGVLDFERVTIVDKKFYKLSNPFQQTAATIMEKISTDQRAIFPYGWQDKMKSQTAIIKE